MTEQSNVVTTVPVDTTEMQMVSLNNFANALGYDFKFPTFVYRSEKHPFNRLGFDTMVRMHNSIWFLDNKLKMNRFKIANGVYFTTFLQTYENAKSMRLVRNVKLYVDRKMGAIISKNNKVEPLYAYAELGYSNADHEHDAVLEDWCIFKGKLFGQIYDDKKKRFENGKPITTSSVDEQDCYTGQIVKTSSGTRYLLGESVHENEIDEIMKENKKDFFSNK